MPATKPANISSVVSKLINLFKAQENSGTLAELAADLNDNVDAAGDLWNSGNHRVPGQAENPVGPNQGMHGTGVDKFVGDYSDATSTNENSPTAILGRMVERQEKLEKAMSGIAACLAIMLKADSDEPDADDEEGDESDDRDETSKAEGLASMSLADAFSFLGPKLSKRAEAAAKAVELKAAKAKTLRGIATPPNMLNPAGRAIQKAAHLEIADTLSDDNSLPLNERIAMRLRSNVARMRSEGADIPATDLRSAVLRRSSNSTRP
jgi:hypothetical protein